MKTTQVMILNNPIAHCTVYNLRDQFSLFTVFWVFFMQLYVFSDIPSRMRGGGVSRTVVIAYLGAGDGPVLNPLKYTSAALKRIIMFCCGPRSGPTACKSGARTVSPDTHVAAGNELHTSLS